MSEARKRTWLAITIIAGIAFLLGMVVTVGIIQKARAATRPKATINCTVPLYSARDVEIRVFHGTNYVSSPIGIVAVQGACVVTGTFTQE